MPCVSARHPSAALLGTGPTSVAPLGLLYRVLRRVALARVHHDLYVLALLVANLQRAAVRRFEFNFQLAIGSVEFGVCWVIGDAVLITDVAADLVENLR